MKYKNLIISLAINGREDYIAKQKGLIATLPIAGDCDHWIFNYYPEGITPHASIPYRFKYDLLLLAHNEGYEKVWWLDSTMRLIKNPFELFEKSEKGIVAFDNLGHPVYKYITDVAAENLKCESYIHDVKNVWGGAIGFDFTKTEPVLILAEIIHQSNIGTFNDGGSKRDGFVAARHDQSCNAVIFHNYGVNILDYGVIAARQHVTPETYIQYGN